MSIIDKLGRIIMVATTLAILASISMSSYWVFFQDVKVIDFIKVTTDKEVYHTGDRIIYTMEYCKYKDIAGQGTRVIKNGYQHTLANIGGKLEIGCHKQSVSDIVIEPFLPSADDYFIEANILYHNVNPFKNYETKWVSNRFEIINTEL